MKLFQSKLVAIASIVLFGCTMSFVACKKDKDQPTVESTVVEASGDITDSVARFKSLIGTLREINWDDVPTSFQQYLPIDFYAATDAGVSDNRKQGFLLLNLSGSFATNFWVNNNDFASTDPSNADQFDAFSGANIFAYIGSGNKCITEAVFRVPGTTTEATVKGFGVVFSDVDKVNTTSIEYFSENGSLGKFYAPVRSGTTSFSFLGVYFPNEKITKIRITCGDEQFGTDIKDISVDPTSGDLVAMDNFIYSEPKLK